MRKILEYIVLFQFFLCSSSAAWNLWVSDREAQFLFLFSSLILFLWRRNRLGSNWSSNLKMSLFIISWILVNVFVINTDVVDLSYIQIITYCISACLVISVFEFNEFRNKLYRIFCALMVISIIVQLLRNFHIVEPQYMMTRNGAYFYFCFNFFNTDWGTWYGFTKLSSIYSEPGQLQIVIVFVLSLFFDELIAIDKWRTNLKKFSPLIIGMILTFSTMAYIMIGLFIAVLTLRGELVKKRRGTMVFISVLSICTIYFLFQSTVVQNKLNGIDYEGQANDSYLVRLNDNIALFRITKENPIFGIGVNTKTFSKYKDLYDSRTSSNGWLNASAKLGTPFVIMLFFFMFYGIKKMNLGLPAFYVLILLIITQCNEPYYYDPYVYLFIFRYCGYPVKYCIQTGSPA